MNKYLPLILIIMISNIYCQSFAIENVAASQSTDGEHILTLSYDLTEDDTFVTFQVTGEISGDGGETWTHIDSPPIENIYGDNIFPGTGKLFEIDLDDYFDDLYSNNAMVRFQAVGHEAITLPSSFEMALVPAGDYLHSYSGSYSNSNPTDSTWIETIDYDYEVTKYLITNAQYAEFLIDQYTEGAIGMIYH